MSSSTIRRLDVSSKEEYLILSNLECKKSLCAVIAAMVQVRVQHTALAQSQMYCDCFERVGEFAQAAHAGKPDAATPVLWGDMVKAKVEDIERTSALENLLEIAGYTPLVVVGDKTRFPENYSSLFTEFFKFSGVQLSFKRTPF